MNEGPTKVLFINRVYPPAQGATGQLLSELAPVLAGKGFDVTILTTGSLFTGSTIQQGNGSTIHIERVAALSFNRASLLQRVFAYLAQYPALLLRALRMPRFDVVVTMTDPPLLLLIGPLIALFKRCQLIHWAQDIYPEVAEELGVLRRRSWIANLLRALSTWALRKQSRIIAIGRCMKRRLLARRLREDRIEIVPNWASMTVLDGAPPSASSSDSFAASGTRTNDGDGHGSDFRRRHNLQDKFIAMYSGNFGLAHSFGEIVEAAQALKPKRPDILFLMIGDGPRFAPLRQRAADLGLWNFQFLSAQPVEELPSVLAAADLHLVTMLPETCGLVVPSKLYGGLAAGRPCLLVGPPQSEAALLIEEFQCGRTISSGAELASALLEFADQPQRLRIAGERARAAAAKFTVELAASAFCRLLRNSAAPVPLRSPESVSRAAA